MSNSGRKQWNLNEAAVPLSAFTVQQQVQQQRSRTPNRSTNSNPSDLESRERGFNTYISGANEERVREHLRRQQAPASTSLNNSTNSPDEAPPLGRTRRQWAESPSFRDGQVALRGADGSVLTTNVVLTPRTASPLPSRRTSAVGGTPPVAAPAPPQLKEMVSTAVATGDSLWPREDSEGSNQGIRHAPRYSERELTPESTLQPQRFSDGATTSGPGEVTPASNPLARAARSRQNSLTPSQATALPPPPRSNSLRMLAVSDTPLRAAGASRAASRGPSPALSQGSSRRTSLAGQEPPSVPSPKPPQPIVRQDSPVAALSRRNSFALQSEPSSSVASVADQDESIVEEEELGTQLTASTSSAPKAPAQPPKIRILSAASRPDQGPVRSLAPAQPLSSASKRPPSAAGNTSVLLAAQRPGTAQSNAPLVSQPSIPTRPASRQSPVPLLQRRLSNLSGLAPLAEKKDMSELLAALQRENEQATTASPLPPPRPHPTPLRSEASPTVPSAGPSPSAAPKPLITVDRRSPNKVPATTVASELPPLELSPAPTSLFAVPPATSIATDSEVVLRVLSAWCETGEVGLTELELIDVNGKKVKPLGIDLRGCSRPLTWTQKESLERLMDGECRTTDPAHMFMFRAPPGDTLEFVVRIPQGVRVSVLSIWNYNRSFLDAAKGVRDVEVFHAGKQAWKGTIPRAAGNPIDTSHNVRVLLADALPTSSITALSAIPEGPDLASSAAPLDLESLGRKAPVMTAPIPLVASSPQKAAASRKTTEEDPLRDSLLDRIVSGIEVSSSAAKAKTAALPSAKDRHPSLPSASQRIRSGRRAGIVREDSRETEEALSFMDMSPPRAPPRLAPAAEDQENTAPPLEPSALPDLDLMASVAGLPGSDAKFGRRKARKLQSTQESLRSIAQFDRSHLGRLGPIAEPPPGSEEGGSREGAGDAVLHLSTEVNAEEAPHALELELGGDEALASLFKRPATSSAKPAASKAKPASGPLPAGQAKEEKAPERGDSEEAGDGSYFSALVEGAFQAAAASAPEPSPPSLSGPKYADLFGSEPFLIPVLPRGAVLEVVIYSTWGDAHYVGLNGIEIFDGEGRPVPINDPEEQVSASPDSVNDLPGVSGDPRVPSNLLDGINITCDDLHSWLVPFTAGQRHSVSIDLGEATTLGCLRFWNLNKSRVHSSRGARVVEVCLDGQPIFRGEIWRAPGAIDPFFAETILFTEDADALEAIEAYDERYRLALQELDQVSSPRDAQAEPVPLPVLEIVAPDGLERPTTAASPMPAPASVLKVLRTPSRTASPAPMGSESVRRTSSGASPVSPAVSGHVAEKEATGADPVRGTEIVIEALENHGDRWYFGLTGLEVLDQNGQAIKIGEVAAFPEDVNILQSLGLVGSNGAPPDPRTFINLVNGENLTTDDADMYLAPTAAWLDLAGPDVRPAPPCPGVADRSAWIRLQLPEETEISALRIFNYNSHKSSEDTARGIKRIRVFVDGDLVCPREGVFLRRAPGHTRYDFSQRLTLSRPAAPIPQDSVALTGAREESDSAWLQMLIGGDLASYQRALVEGSGGREVQELRRLQTAFDVPILPSGFTLTVVIRDTHGDEHFVGLTGVEVIDAVVGRLPASAMKISVSPIAAVKEMPGMENDIRTPDKLLSGNNTGAPQHTWLAPFVREGRVIDSDRSSMPAARFHAPGQGQEYERGALAVISLVMDRPVLLGALRFFNYGPRNVHRGVKDLEVYLDGRHIFSGALQKAAPEGPPAAQTILFSGAMEVVAKFSSEIIHAEEQDTEQSILCLNDEDMQEGGDQGSGSNTMGGADRSYASDSVYGGLRANSALFSKLQGPGYLPPRPNTAVVQ